LFLPPLDEQFGVPSAFSDVEDAQPATSTIDPVGTPSLDPTIAPTE
jgi:hypothetical protein